METDHNDNAPSARTTPPAPRGRTRPNVAAVESCYQFLRWLIPVLDGMPRRQKYQLGDRVQTQALDVQEALVEAAYTRERAALLRQANMGLEKLRIWCRLAKDLQLLSFAQYEHAARQIDELGRQVGGWLKAERGALNATHGTAAP